MSSIKLIWRKTGIKGDSQLIYGFDTGKTPQTPTDLGHVFKTSEGKWGASWTGGFDTYGTRHEAMARVETEVARQRRRKRR